MVTLLSVGCDNRAADADSTRPVRVTVVDADTGQPLAGLRVRSFRDSGVEVFRGRTDAAGQATWMEGRRDAELRIDDPDKSQYVAREVRLAGDPSDTSATFAEAELRLAVGRGVHVEVLAAQAAELGDSDERDDSAENDDSAKSPIEGARVEAWPLGGLPVRGTSDADGRCVLGPFEPGAVSVVVQAPGRAVACQTVHVQKGRDAMARFRLRPGGVELSGQLPRDIARRARGVAYRMQGLRLAGRLSSDGSFRFEGLPPGSGEVVVQGRSGELFSRSVELPEVGSRHLGRFTP